MGLEKDGTARNLSPQEAKFIVDASQENRFKPQIVAWDIKKDVDLARPENYPDLGNRDLLPHLGLTYAEPARRQSPGAYRPPEAPHNFFAIGKRADGMPLEIIEYDHDTRGSLQYKQQYLFQYDKMPDGQNRVTVQNWTDSARAQNEGPTLNIGAHLNTLVSVSQYYRNGAQLNKAEFWTAASVTKPTIEYDHPGSKDAVKKEVKYPDVRIEFAPDTSNVIISKKGYSGLMGGGINERGNEALSDLRELLPKYSFYDLFGPKLGQ